MSLPVISVSLKSQGMKRLLTGRSTFIVTRDYEPFVCLQAAVFLSILRVTYPLWLTACS
jgi:hypothetical protein